MGISPFKDKALAASILGGSPPQVRHNDGVAKLSTNLLIVETIRFRLAIFGFSTFVSRKFFSMLRVATLAPGEYSGGNYMDRVPASSRRI